MTFCEVPGCGRRATYEIGWSLRCSQHKNTDLGAVGLEAILKAAEGFERNVCLIGNITAGQIQDAIRRLESPEPPKSAAPGEAPLWTADKAVEDKITSALLETVESLNETGARVAAKRIIDAFGGAEAAPGEGVDLEAVESAENLRRFGYAPGTYYITCSGCGRTDEDCDKRAIRCLQCATLAAYRAYFEQRHAPEAAPKAAEGPEWACCGCGNMERDTFRTIEHSGNPAEPVDYDMECTKCGSREIEESPREALSRVTTALDTALAELETLKAARPADPREAEPAGRWCWVHWAEGNHPSAVASKYLHPERIADESRGKWVRMVEAPESQPHTVHPWDRLEKLKNEGKILFYAVDRYSSKIQVTLFHDGAGRWVQAELPTISEAVQAAVEKLPVGIRP